MHDPSLQAVRRAAAFESTVLENGLTVRVHTMPGFTGVHLSLIHISEPTRH